MCYCESPLRKLSHPTCSLRVSWRNNSFLSGVSASKVFQLADNKIGPEVSEEAPPSLDEVRTAFAAVGLPVEVDERMLALTASVDGGMLLGVYVIVGAGLARFGELVADDAHEGLKTLLRRFHRRGSTDYVVCATANSIDGISARIDPDLPAEAYMKLQGKLPPAPSGELVYNRELRQWEDSGWP
jgi:hypothetical protein